MTKLERMLGLARKAGALACGTNNVISAVKGGKALLVLIASDASDGTEKMLRDKAAWRSIPTHSLPFTKSELAHIIGKSECAAVAVTNSQFAVFYHKATEDSIQGGREIYGDNK